jgi:hypothetical protein
MLQVCKCHSEGVNRCSWSVVNAPSHAVHLPDSRLPVSLFVIAEQRLNLYRHNCVLYFSADTTDIVELHQQAGSAR